MKRQPTPREIQRWYPERWDEVAGNTPVVQVWHDFLKHGGTNMLFTGPSRTGKTRTTSLGIMAAMCPHISPEKNPCGACTTCRDLMNARESLWGIFSISAGSRKSYFSVDCESVTVEELKQLTKDAGREAESATTLIYLDEVAALGRRGIDTLMLKAIDETPAIWIASAIAVRKRDDRGRVKRTLGLSDPMLARFAIKVGTTLPRETEMATWIKARCREWDIAIEQEALTVPLAIKRSRHRVGMAILVLSVAASRGRRLTYDLVAGFDFQAAD